MTIVCMCWLTVKNNIYIYVLFPFSYCLPNTEHQTKLVHAVANMAIAVLYYALQVLW